MGQNQVSFIEKCSLFRGPLFSGFTVKIFIACQVGVAYRTVFQTGCDPVSDSCGKRQDIV